MSNTRVSVLTPPGSGAIAVLAVDGVGALPVVRRLFHPFRGRPLPVTPPSGIRFGRFGGPTGDEVLLVVHDPESVEIHCHGGRQVVEWLVGLLRAEGVNSPASGRDAIPGFVDATAAELLTRAATVRTASILLDQANGAYARAVAAIAAGGPEAATTADVLRRNARVGRHLVEPWAVAIAGAPNAGKSTLLNALAGFDRSVVSPVPGTTRDAVSVPLAFDGWPVTLIDTAGIREDAEHLEREGIDRARQAVTGSDLCLWVIDATGPGRDSRAAIAAGLGRRPEDVLLVWNKCDLAAVPDGEQPDAIRASAKTGQGLPDLAARIVAALVPDPPRPGEPVPYTPDQCDQWL